MLSNQIQLCQYMINTNLKTLLFNCLHTNDFFFTQKSYIEMRPGNAGAEKKREKQGN